MNRMVLYLAFLLLFFCKGSFCQTLLCANASLWGRHCNETCEEGCILGNCEKNTGRCTDLAGNVTDECKLGYKGTNCKEHGCQQSGVWKETCTMACGDGCPDFDNDGYPNCNFDDGACVTDELSCLDGYKGMKCDIPICRDCNGGTCVAPGLCQLCPVHFDSGTTCRSIRLEGFLQGSLPTFAILAGVIVFLNMCSNAIKHKKPRR